MLCSSLFDLLYKPRQGPTIKKPDKENIQDFSLENFPIGFHF